jgi:hypothetical protein
MFWAPLIISWRDWIAKRASGIPVLVMRDAKPLSVVPVADVWPKVWLNRSCCGIPDELSGESLVEIDPLVEDYLRQNQLNQHFTFVDSGCWGTIVMELHCRMDMSFQPLFFFSHNPSIPGFLNELGFGGEEGEILNDSLECCFPNMVMRPSHFIRMGGQIVPHLQKMDDLSITFYNAALEGVRSGALSLNGNRKSPIEVIECLLDLSRQARGGEFTGILPNHSPTWSKGKKFLADWPPHLRWT